MESVGTWRIEWQRSLGLEERLSTTPPPLTIDRQRGQGAVADWRAQTPFQPGEQGELWWQKNLARHAVTAEQLQDICGETIASLSSRYPEPPAWVTWCAQIGQGDRSLWATSLRELRGRQQLGSSFRALVASPFLEILWPFVAQGLAEIAADWAEICQEPAAQKIFAALTQVEIGLGLLPQQLLNVFEKTLVLEMHVIMTAESLSLEQSQKVLRDRIQSDCYLSLFNEYPVLGQQAWITVGQWVDFSKYLCQCLVTDWQRLSTELEFNPDLDLPVAVAGDGSDRHPPGRTVVFISLSSGKKILFKPRSLAAEQQFYDLTNWLGHHPDFPEQLPNIKTIDRHDYGWTEYIDSTEPAMVELAVWRSRYRQLGAYQALFYALGTTDLHQENCLLQGGNVYFVDLESLCEAPINHAEALFVKLPAHRAIANSVLRSGLLPQPNLRSRENQAYFEPSTLGAIVRRCLEVAHQSGGELVQMGLEEAIDGFSQVYNWLWEHRQEFQDRAWLYLRDLSLRLIVRDTQIYERLLQVSFHPDFVRNALRREQLFDRLWAEVPELPYLQRIIRAEVQALKQGCIPRFTTHLTSCDLEVAAFSHDDGPDASKVKNFLPHSAWDALVSNLECLSPEDLDQQRSIIRHVWGTVVANHSSDHQSCSMPTSGLKIAHAQTIVDRVTAIHLAKDIAKYLTDVAAMDDQYIGWAAPTLVGKNWGLAPAGWDLYNGIPGIALFFACLHRVTNKSQYADIARRAMAGLMVQIEKYGDQLHSLGLFTGWGGLIYTCSQLGSLWQENYWYDQAGDWAGRLDHLIARDSQLDVLTGSAGCIIALLDLYNRYPRPEFLALARHCGERLRQQAIAMPIGMGWPTVGQQTPLGGYSHGAAGIALALLRLSVALSAPCYREMAEAAIAYERSLYSPDQNNWVDLRTAQPSYPCSWSHGATGIGWARLSSRQYLHDAAMDREIAQAVRATVVGSQHWHRYNHSLGNGSLGNLLFLQAAGNPQIDALAQSILGDGARDGWRSDTPNNLPLLGLMAGISGIGYGYLRLYFPDIVPDLLMPS